MLYFLSMVPSVPPCCHVQLLCPRDWSFSMAGIPYLISLFPHWGNPHTSAIFHHNAYTRTCRGPGEEYDGNA